MVALAELNGDPPPPKDSIMGLFGDEPEHRTLSGKDMALLRGIYSMPPDREAYQHRNRLVGAVRKGEDWRSAALGERIFLRPARDHRVAGQDIGDRDRRQRGVGGIERREVGV